MSGRVGRSWPRIVATGRHPNGRQTLKLERTLTRHGYTDPGRATLLFACLSCGSIGETSGDRGDRDVTVLNTDLTCCDPRTTVVFLTTGHPDAHTLGAS